MGAPNEPSSESDKAAGPADGTGRADGAGRADQDGPLAPSDSHDDDEPDRVASLHDLIEDDPYLTEPFWPPILMGLGLVVIISLAILWKHGVIGGG